MKTPQIYVRKVVLPEWLATYSSYLPPYATLASHQTGYVTFDQTKYATFHLRRTWSDLSYLLYVVPLVCQSPSTVPYLHPPIRWR